MRASVYLFICVSDSLRVHVCLQHLDVKNQSCAYARLPCVCVFSLPTSRHKMVNFDQWYCSSESHQSNRRSSQTSNAKKQKTKAIMPNKQMRAIYKIEHKNTVG